MLGPNSSPRRSAVGEFDGQVRQMSSGFQEEIRNALDVPTGVTPSGESKLPRRPEEADITEASRPDSEGDVDDHSNGAGPSHDRIARRPDVSRAVLRNVHSGTTTGDHEDVDEHWTPATVRRADPHPGPLRRASP